MGMSSPAESHNSIDAMTTDPAAPVAGRMAKRTNDAAIFGAALEAFSAKGFNGASMRDIATHAGTSVSNLYNYVQGKADLLAQVLQDANHDLLASLEEVLETAEKTATDRLNAAVRAYVLWSVRQQMAGLVALGEFRYLQGPLRDQVVAERDRTQHVFSVIVAEGVKSTEFLTPHPHEAARSIVLLCATLVTWYRPNGKKSPAQVAEEQARLALALVEARFA